MPVFFISRSVSGSGTRQAGSRTWAVTDSKSLAATWFIGSTAAGDEMFASFSRSQSGGTALGRCAVTMNPDDQPGGTFTGTTAMSQSRTGPACTQFQGPTTSAGALTPSVSVTSMGPLKLPVPTLWTVTRNRQSQVSPASMQGPSIL